MLDELSRQIIRELQRDGRQSNRAIAKKLGVSEGSVRNRMRELYEKKVLRIGAIVDPRKLNINFISIVGLKVSPGHVRQAAEEIAQKPNVYYLTLIAGSFDIMVMLLFNSLTGLTEFMQKELAAIPGLLQHEVFFNIEILKSPWEKAPEIMDIV